MTKIRVSPMFVFLLCLAVYLGWSGVVGAAILAAVCHELGHIGALLVCRKKILRVNIGIAGAVMETEPLGYTQELFCAVMGPAINLLLFCIFLHTNFMFSFVNLLLLGYNLLPVYPLDGGRILRSLLLLLLPELIVARIVHVTGFLVSLSLMMVSVCLAVKLQCGLWPVFLAGILLCRMGRMAAREGY